MTPGETLRHLRKSKNLTQHQLGQLVGYQSQSVSQWEADRNSPLWTTLKALDEVLGAEGEVLRIYGAPFVPGPIGFNGEWPEEVVLRLQRVDEQALEIAELRKLSDEQAQQIARLTRQLNTIVRLRLDSDDDDSPTEMRAAEA